MTREEYYSGCLENVVKTKPPVAEEISPVNDDRVARLQRDLSAYLAGDTSKKDKTKGNS